jgi:hypothetical protein
MKPSSGTTCNLVWAQQSFIVDTLRAAAKHELWLRKPSSVITVQSPKVGFLNIKVAAKHELLCNKPTIAVNKCGLI